MNYLQNFDLEILKIIILTHKKEEKPQRKLYSIQGGLNAWD